MLDHDPIPYGDECRDRGLELLSRTPYDNAGSLLRIAPWSAVEITVDRQPGRLVFECVFE